MFGRFFRPHPRPRYLPERSFPPYAHDPGITAHPYRDDGGHSHGQDEPTVPPLDPADPMGSEALLWGLDLFNHGYFWEAHVWWEALWVAHERTGDIAEVVQALIKLAAAGVKARAAVPGGVRSHCEGAADKLEAVAARTEARWLLGIDLPELAAHARSVAERTPEQGLHDDFEGGRWAWSLRLGDPKGRGRVDPAAGLPT
jgi:hypothetical protein